MPRIDFGKIGNQRLEAFLVTVSTLIVSQKQEFDVIIAPGNSGIGLAKCVQLLYRKLKRKAPTVIQMPIFRPGRNQTYDYTNEIRRVRKLLRNTPGRVLVVDDEIGAGNAVKTSLVILTQALQTPSHARMTAVIVAEDNGFKCPTKWNGIPIRFVPYAKHTLNVYNAISYCIPLEIENHIKRVYSDSELDSKARMNVLLGVPVKILQNGVPRLTRQYETRLKKRIRNFSGLQKAFRKYIEKRIDKSISRAMSGKKLN